MGSDMDNRDVLRNNTFTKHQKRKEEHLNICSCEDVEFKEITTGLENYYFLHQAVPEIDLSGIDLSISLFGKRLSAPIIISPMVGGIESAIGINQNLAQVAQALGLAMGVGSQRGLISFPELRRTYQVRDIAPDILLLANLGAVQLNYGFGISECLEIIEAVNADVLVLHFNPLQEALQPEGNTNFSGLLKKIEQVCRALPVPVVAKEVGGGISEKAARHLFEAGVSGIDVAGAGGTCWSEIERKRSLDKLGDSIARNFASWGIPTAESIIMTKRGAPEVSLIASGGIRTGIDVAKAIALGADAAGIATPLLKAAKDSSLEAENLLIEVIEVLRVAMFCIGAANISELKLSPSLRKKGE